MADVVDVDCKADVEFEVIVAWLDTDSGCDCDSVDSVSSSSCDEVDCIVEVGCTIYCEESSGAGCSWLFWFVY